MDNRVLVWGGLGLAALAFLLLALLIAQDTGGELEAADPVVVAVPEPREAPEVAAAPRYARVPVPAPDGVERPEPPPVRPPSADVTPDEYRAMNYAMDDVIRNARQACIEPWLDETMSALEAEFVFDAVLYDGRMYDFGLRSLSSDVPAPVMDCMRDQAWYGDWPDFDIRGELTLQRSITAKNQAARDLPQGAREP